MANRYWVGGNGTWNTTNTANWSTTSGGTGGASVPTSADIAVFNASSGAAVVTLSGTLSCAYIFADTGFTGTIDFGSSTIHMYSAAYGLYAVNSACTIAFGSSNITVDSDFYVGIYNTVTAGTAVISLTDGSAYFSGGGKTYNEVRFTSTALSRPRLLSADTFNTLQIQGRASPGNASFAVYADLTIGTLNLIAGASQECRVMLRSDAVGTTRTFTVTTCTSAGYTDFRDIAITGSAAPISGSYIGDCGGNSGITFPSPKTSYYVGTGTFDATASWSNTSTGAGSSVYFPLAQDTAVITNFAPSAFGSLSIGAIFRPINIGTLDCSARTDYVGITGYLALYGNYVGGTGANPVITLEAYPRAPATISCAGNGFDIFRMNALGSGTVTFSDAFSSQFLYLDGGSLTAAANVTVQYLTSTVTTTRSIDFGPGTWTISGDFSYTATNLTVAGTGTISLTSASAKTFAGNNIQTWPALDQGGAGALTITGSNKFKGLTNSYGATAATTIKFTGGTTNEFDDISLYGSAGKLCTLTSTDTTPIILKKGSAWRIGPNSVNGGNNTGLLFMAGNGDYLNVSYINAQPFAGGDMMLIFGF